MKQDIYDPTKSFNEQIRQLIKVTQPQEGPFIVVPHGKRFQKRMDWDYWKHFHQHQQDTPDGIGTKGLLHYLMDTLESGVQDAFAMSTGDLMEGGYTPFYLTDYIEIQKEDEGKILRLIRKLCELCIQYSWETVDGKRYPIAITGGDTAIINTLQGFEMGITATGYVRKDEEIVPNAREGDVIIGLGSNGLHSNGFSFYRQELFEKRSMTIETVLPWGPTVGEELTKPTHIYLPALKELISQMRKYVHGMVHITGGAFTKFKELMPGKDVDIEIGRNHGLRPQEILRFGYELDPSSEKMYKRFNNGVGYAVAVQANRAEQALSILKKRFPVEIIGVVNRGTGRISIESQYDNSTVVYKA